MISEVTQIPSNTRLILFGAGTFGEVVARAIFQERPDVEIVAFADNHQSGQKFGRPIWNPETLQTNRSQYDAILISSGFIEEIHQQLKRMELSPIWLGHPALMHHYSLLHPATEEHLDRARQLLSSDEDRAVYEAIIEARRGKPDALKMHVQARDLHPKRQYLDFINFDSIQVAVEGGVFDGFTSQQFMKRMPETAHLHGFEPFIELYEQGPYRPQLDPHRVHVHAKGLWNENTSLNFSQDALEAAESGGASKVVRSPNEPTTRQIQAVRLDDWVQEQGLDRLDFFKLDIEGSEPEAIEGAKQSLMRFRPQLAICIYHHPTHLYQIPIQLSELLPNYRWHVQHYSMEIWETVWYGLPLEKR
ncbi:MAG: FkbM family methyltransferase [Acidobacteria bacterium]|nr:FkbM family methyltransferase [Acidobacteriota bacterium]MCB9396348.1 FkbM family methyltransferase [Acidobacteriota bacterium]